MKNRELAQIILLGFALGVTLTARRMNKQMSNLHDDMLAKVQKLKERAQAAAAKGTQMEQNWTDVSAQLDEVTKILDDFVKDDASSGGSTGGAAISVSGQQQTQNQSQQQNSNAQLGAQQPGASDGQTADSAKDPGRWRAR
jgi:hypothetical protein